MRSNKGETEEIIEIHDTSDEDSSSGWSSEELYCWIKKVVIAECVAGVYIQVLVENFARGFTTDLHSIGIYSVQDFVENIVYLNELLENKDIDLVTIDMLHLMLRSSIVYLYEEGNYVPAS